jgi:hypothetical protein
VLEIYLKMEVFSLILIVYSINYTGENDYVCFGGGGREVKLFYIKNSKWPVVVQHTYNSPALKRP